jgi:hypothetical protein
MRKQRGARDGAKGLHGASSSLWFLVKPNTYHRRNARRFLRAIRFGITVQHATTRRAPLLNSLRRTSDPWTNFPHAHFAVKHFPDNTVAPVFIQSSAKTSRSCFFTRDGDGAGSINTYEKRWRWITIASVRR